MWNAAEAKRAAFPHGVPCVTDHLPVSSSLQPVPSCREEFNSKRAENPSAELDKTVDWFVDRPRRREFSACSHKKSHSKKTFLDQSCDSSTCTRSRMDR